VAKPREWLLDKLGTSAWADLLQCYWCLAAYVSTATVLALDHWTSVPLPAAVIIGSGTVVGLLNVYEES
jgi:hypothetical protein